MWSKLKPFHVPKNPRCKPRTIHVPLFFSWPLRNGRKTLIITTCAISLALLFLLFSLANFLPRKKETGEKLFAACESLFICVYVSIKWLYPAATHGALLPLKVATTTLPNLLPSSHQNYAGESFSSFTLDNI